MVLLGILSAIFVGFILTTYFYVFPFVKSLNIQEVNRLTPQVKVFKASAIPSSQEQIKVASVQNPSTQDPKPTVTPESSSKKESGKSWEIQGVSSMKETKDRVCNQPNDSYISSWVNKAVELGVNYISIETPYENPACGDGLSYTKRWVNAIRSKGLKVWHRHMPLAFEGIYDSPKTPGIDTLSTVTSYIKGNPGLFRSGDIFTPIPEPQNGGIKGVTYCHNGICQFDGAAHFNSWLRDAVNVSKDAFASVGISNIKVGYFGFDGFVAWGHNNPDWEGILESSTVSLMGNITIDHYPEAVGTQMGPDLDELQRMFPGVPVIIGEWGTIKGRNVIDQVKNSMGAAKRPGVIGFNYWHLGMGGNEALINNDFSQREQFETVKSFFKP